MKININANRKEKLGPKLSLNTPMHLQVRKAQKENQIQINVLQIHSILPKQESFQVNLIKPQRHSADLYKPQRLSIKTQGIQRKDTLFTPNLSINPFTSKKVSLKSIEEKPSSTILNTQRELSKPSQTDVVRNRSKTTTPSMLRIRKNSFHSPLQQNDAYKQSFIDIEQSLKKDSLIEPYHSLYFNIRRQNFHQIIIKIIKTLFACKNKTQFKSDIFRSSLQSIKNNILKKQENNSRLSIINKTFTFDYSSQKYEKEWGNQKATLDELQQSETNLQTEILHNREILAQINEVSRAKLEQVSKLEQQDYVLNQRLKEKEENILQMQGRIASMQKYLNEVQDKYQRMINYIQTQDKNKIIKLISKDYIDIQADIYDYAVYLQHNQLANDIYYQPHPFKQIQRLILQEMKVLNTSIINNNEKSTTQKNARMRDFILYAMDKFQKKDAEMFKLNQFKTKCALTFISKMKKWLNNWELKQEYLVNLKKDYAAITLAVSRHLKEMMSKDYKQRTQDIIREDIKRVIELFQQLQINFSLGNSFY